MEAFIDNRYQKPGCRAEVFDYFRNAPDAEVTSPSQIAVVGDRLFTDVMMANLMGAHGFWVKDGTIGPHSFVCLECLESSEVRFRKFR